MNTKEYLKYSKTVSDSLSDMEGINTADDDHVEGNCAHCMVVWVWSLLFEQK